MKNKEFIEKKCPNCGAQLEFSLEDKEVTCKYCNSEFIIRDNNVRNMEFDLNKINLEAVKAFTKVHLIIFFVIFAIFSITFVCVGFGIFKGFKNTIFSDSNAVEKIKISADELDFDLKDNLISLSQNEFKKWNGNRRTEVSDNIKAEGFYYLKNNSSTKVICVVSCEYTVDGEVKTVYTPIRFNGYSDKVSEISRTPYISTNTLMINSYEWLYGYDSIKHLYDSEVKNNLSKYKVVSTDNLKTY